MSTTKHRLTVLFTLVFFFLFSSCASQEERAIKDVKNLTLEYDKSITVGQLLDNNKHMSDRTWNYYEDDMGRKVVEFNAIWHIVSVHSSAKELEESKKELKRYGIECHLKLLFIKMENDYEFAYAGRSYTFSDRVLATFNDGERQKYLSNYNLEPDEVMPVLYSNNVPMVGFTDIMLYGQAIQEIKRIEKEEALKIFQSDFPKHVKRVEKELDRLLPENTTQSIYSGHTYVLFNDNYTFYITNMLKTDNALVQVYDTDEVFASVFSARTSDRNDTQLISPDTPITIKFENNLSRWLRDQKGSNIRITIEDDFYGFQGIHELKLLEPKNAEKYYHISWTSDNVDRFTRKIHADSVRCQDDLHIGEFRVKDPKIFTHTRKESEEEREKRIAEEKALQKKNLLKETTEEIVDNARVVVNLINKQIEPLSADLKSMFTHGNLYVAIDGEGRCLVAFQDQKSKRMLALLMSKGKANYFGITVEESNAGLLWIYAFDHCSDSKIELHRGSSGDVSEIMVKADSCEGIEQFGAFDKILYSGTWDYKYYQSQYWFTVRKIIFEVDGEKIYKELYLR